MNSFVERLRKHRRWRSDVRAERGVSARNNDPLDRVTIPSADTATLSPAEDGILASPTADFGDSRLTLSPGNGQSTPPNLSNRRANMPFVAVDGDLGAPSQAVVSMRRTSRLSRNLAEVMQNPRALSYLIQFMESRGLGHLLRFWLDAKTFGVSAAARCGAQRSRERFHDQLRSDAVHSTTQHSDDACTINNGGATASCSSEASVSATDRKPKSALEEMTENDALNIFSKFIAKDAPQSIGATAQVHDSVINKLCSEIGSTEPDCFKEAQDFVFGIVEKRYFPEFLKSVYFCRYQLEVLTGQNFSLADILYSETALAYFCQFMETCSQFQFVDFWMAANRFRESLLKEGSEIDGLVAQDQAMIIYDRYISMQAVHPLNLDEKHRISVENNICREGGPLADCFDTAQRIIYSRMEAAYLPAFRQSAQFRQFMADLLKTVENTLELPDPSGRRWRKRGGGGSGDASSGTIGIGIGGGGGVRSTQSDLGFFDDCSTDLVGGTHRSRSSASFAGATVSADVLQSSADPDAIWRRPPDHGFVVCPHLDWRLNLAEIDAMGHLVRNYESVSQPTSSRSIAPAKTLKNNLRKMVKNQTKEEESAMAEDIAKLILNDVMQMTNN